MLSHSKLSKSFLDEVMRTAINLIDLSLSAPLQGDMSERVWIEKDISYDHFKVFGCRTLIHIPKDEISKFDGKSKQYIFLGLHMKSLVTDYGIQLVKIL